MGAEDGGLDVLLVGDGVIATAALPDVQAVDVGLRVNVLSDDAEGVEVGFHFAPCLRAILPTC